MAFVDSAEIPTDLTVEQPNLVGTDFNTLSGTPSFMSQVTTPTGDATTPFAQSDAMLAEEMGYGNDFVYGGAGANGAGGGTSAAYYSLGNPLNLPTINSPGANAVNPTLAGTTAGTTGGSTENVGLVPQLAKAIGGVGAYASSWLTRGFLIVIGLVIAAIGIMHVMDPASPGRAVRKVMGG
jgi:hypothetical protein